MTGEEVEGPQDAHRTRFIACQQKPTKKDDKKEKKRRIRKEGYMMSLSSIVSSSLPPSPFLLFLFSSCNIRFRLISELLLVQNSSLFALGPHHDIQKVPLLHIVFLLRLHCLPLLSVPLCFCPLCNDCLYVLWYNVGKGRGGREGERESGRGERGRAGEGREGERERGERERGREYILY